MAEPKRRSIKVPATVGRESRAAWMNQAARRVYPVAWWFARLGPRRRAAIRICGRCPVRDDCLAYALELADEPYGIWGGLTMDERRSLVRRRSQCDESVPRTA